VAGSPRTRAPVFSAAHATISRLTGTATRGPTCSLILPHPTPVARADRNGFVSASRQEPRSRQARRPRSHSLLLLGQAAMLTVERGKSLDRPFRPGTFRLGLGLPLREVFCPVVSNRPITPRGQLSAPPVTAGPSCEGCLPEVGREPAQAAQSARRRSAPRCVEASPKASPAQCCHDFASPLTGEAWLVNPLHQSRTARPMNTEHGINNLSARQIELRRAFSHLGALALNGNRTISTEPDGRLQKSQRASPPPQSSLPKTGGSASEAML
jgi:hypothetical protein